MQCCFRSLHFSRNAPVLNTLFLPLQTFFYICFVECDDQEKFVSLFLSSIFSCSVSLWRWLSELINCPEQFSAIFKRFFVSLFKRFIPFCVVFEAAVTLCCHAFKYICIHSLTHAHIYSRFFSIKFVFNYWTHDWIVNLCYKAYTPDLVRKVIFKCTRFTLVSKMLPHCKTIVKGKKKRVTFRLPFLPLTNTLYSSLFIICY